MIGETLAHFRIDAELGAGGMGEVYRARDTKLDRDVAIKVLPEGLDADPERLARFEREAKVLASLNHPNIAAIYAFEAVPAAESAGPIHFLVMELVEGETLAKRLTRGRLSVEESLPIALGIARALEAAHEHHVIHRDLKPGNVMVTPEGQVKVLDFGLAKALTAGKETGRRDEDHQDFGEAPTLTAEMTRAGVALGTASYMSPEQVRAGALDKRTDIWSFGVVLWEMLAGERLFAGDSISDTMAEVLKSEPDPSSLPSDLPLAVRKLIGRCLTKDAGRRLRDIGEARIALEDVLSGDSDPRLSEPVAERTRRMHLLPWLVAVAAAVLAVVALWQATSRPSEKAVPEVSQTSIPLPEGVVLALTQRTSIAVSPDGSTVAFVGALGNGRKLWLRPLSSSEAAPIEGTEGAESPVFSPDGEWIGFVAGTRLKMVATAGGPIRDIAFMAPVSRGLEWVDEKTLVATPTKSGGLWGISTVTGASEAWTQPDTEGLGGHCWSDTLPDGRRALVTSLPVEATSWDEARILLVDLESGETAQLVDGGSQARYLETGHIVYASRGRLIGARFDFEQGALTGPPVVLLEDLFTNPASGAGQFAVTDDGTLVYARGGSQPVSTRRLLWVDRSGQEEPIVSEPRSFYYPRIAPDGRSVLLTIEAASDDVWVLDLERDVFQRLTFGPRHLLPTWGPGPGQVTYSAPHGGFPAVYIRSLATGEERHLVGGDEGVFAGSWSPDGSMLVAGTANGSNWNIVRVSVDGEMEVLFDSPFNEGAPRISPDGRRLAYVSNESGRPEVFVTSFPRVDRRVQVSVDGGSQPVWSQTGGSLFFVADGGIHEVTIDGRDGLEASAPRLVVAGDFPGAGSVPFVAQYDVDRDGERFLVLDEEPLPEITRLEVVLNWFEELERRMQASGQ